MQRFKNKIARVGRKGGKGAKIGNTHGFKKGEVSLFKGRTYEDIYGTQKATQLKKLLKERPLHENHGKASTKEKEIERIEKIRKSLLGNQNSKGRGKRVIYKKYKLRSIWELKVAIYLERNNIEWKYEINAYKLSGNRTYRPDFFIYKNDVLIKLIEVKGYWYEKNMKKFEDFKREYDIPIELWDKNKLKLLKLI